MIASYLTMDEKPFQGWLTDSTGTFKIEHLKRGKYQLVAQFVGLNSCDTLVTIPFQSDTLRITLPLWYEYIEKYDCSPTLSREYIDKGKPNLKLIIPVGKEEVIRKHPFGRNMGLRISASFP